MSDEFKLLKQRELGERVKKLREDELLSQIFEGLKAEYILEWAQSNPLDKEARENWYFRLRGLMAVREQMKAIITTGNAAKTFLESASAS